MSYRHVALMGRAGAGKDTAAARLVQRYAFVRVAFADPLKESALRLDPIVGAEGTSYGALPIRLSDVVKRYGWDRAKNSYPEVRRTLQNLGEAVRADDPDFWLRMALDKVTTADRWSLPVVISDVRYANEADALRAAGALMVRIERPGASAGGEAARHVSELDLDAYPADVTVSNTGTVADLDALVDALAIRR
ncbi:deoxynucleotide monophosphate kinase family protein [Streptomyces anulatus]|uniref:deoxynucleotide monophosphate kinase family protein n=1 Tax=Streptomyces anulatus TaxID=1892 RepID=UPI00364B7BFA